MLGGTLTELAWMQGKIDELRAWLDDLGIEHVEVSSGVVPMPSDDKAALIETLARERTVYAEVTSGSGTSAVSFGATAGGCPRRSRPACRSTRVARNAGPYSCTYAQAS